MRAYVDVLETMGVSIMTCKKHGVKFYDVCGCQLCWTEMDKELDEWAKTACLECCGEGRVVDEDIVKYNKKVRAEGNPDLMKECRVTCPVCNGTGLK